MYTQKAGGVTPNQPSHLTARRQRITSASWKKKSAKPSKPEGIPSNFQAKKVAHASEPQKLKGRTVAEQDIDFGNWLLSADSPDSGFSSAQPQSGNTVPTLFVFPDPPSTEQKDDSDNDSVFSDNDSVFSDTDSVFSDTELTAVLTPQPKKLSKYDQKKKEDAETAETEEKAYEKYKKMLNSTNQYLKDSKEEMPDSTNQHLKDSKEEMLDSINQYLKNIQKEMLDSSNQHLKNTKEGTPQSPERISVDIPSNVEEKNLRNHSIIRNRLSKEKSLRTSKTHVKKREATKQAYKELFIEEGVLDRVLKLQLIEEGTINLRARCFQHQDFEAYDQYGFDAEV